MAPDSPLQNEVANLERQVLEAKKAALQKQLQTLTAANRDRQQKDLPQTKGRQRTQTLGCFMSTKVRNLILFPLMRKYRSVDIQHIRDIKKNKFKSEKIMKLSTSVRRTREAAKILKIGTSGL